MSVVDADIRLYSVQQLATLWGCGRTFVYSEIKAGRLPVVGLGDGEPGTRTKMRVRATAALEWIERKAAASQ